MFKFIYRLFVDLYRTYVPSNAPQNGFAFVVRPRDYNDVVSNVPFLKILPKSVVMALFPYVWPYTVSGIYGLKSLKTNESLPGWVIGVPIFAHDMVENREAARKKIARAVNLAKNKGAKVIGLGGLTGSIMEGGAGMSKKEGMTITAGRAYTSHVVKSYADDTVRTLGLDKKDLTVAVVGAAGGVGTAVTRLLVNEPYGKILLIDLDRRLEKVVKEIDERAPGKSHIEISHQVRRVKEADIIITVTNAPEAVVESEDIKTGAIIIDDAQPSDISPEVIKTRHDIIVIEAGVIASDNEYKIGTNFRLANKNEIYCCSGEVMAIAASDWQGTYEPGNITPEIVEELALIASQIGFKLAPYQAFGRLVPEDRIQKVKGLVRPTTSSQTHGYL